jgi:hypothetical protein
MGRARTAAYRTRHGGPGTAGLERREKERGGGGGVRRGREGLIYRTVYVYVCYTYDRYRDIDILYI